MPTRATVLEQSFVLVPILKRDNALMVEPTVSKDSVFLFVVLRDGLKHVAQFIFILALALCLVVNKSAVHLSALGCDDVSSADPPIVLPLALIVIAVFVVK